MRQSLLRPFEAAGGSRTEKWIYEGGLSALHGEHAAVPSEEVMHDVFGPGNFLRRGIEKRLLIKFKNDIGEPNPRAVTCGHVYNPELLPQPPPPLMRMEVVDAPVFTAENVIGSFKAADSVCVILHNENGRKIFGYVGKVSESLVTFITDPPEANMMLDIPLMMDDIYELEPIVDQTG